jgi:copper homeostasis protein
MLLEIAVSNIQAAQLAQQAGAHRIELCDNLREGGTTPSFGYLQQARKKISIPVYPIIRPRGGDFLYNDEEFAIMKQDVLLCKQLGFEGVVIGLLQTDGTVDVKRTAQLVQIAWPMGVTFHRAFDRTNDPFSALENIIETGCERVLTSGLMPDAPTATAFIKELVDAAGDQIIIMPGSGVRASNLEMLVRQTGATEFHSSAKITTASAMQYRNARFPENDGAYDTVDGAEVAQMKNILLQAEINYR